MADDVRTLVTVPSPRLLTALDGLEGIDGVVWDFGGPAPAEEIDLAVLPAGARFAPELFEGVRIGLLQATTIGYDQIVELVPDGVPIANAASVHEPAAAELALALTLAMQRDLPRRIRAASAGWSPGYAPGLTDKHVVLLGYGGIGTLLERMLIPFGVQISRIASRARMLASGAVVHGAEALDAVLPDADVVIIAVPLTASTEHLVDRAFLARLPDSALVVNIARGRIADTDAILEEAARGRLRFALDVTDPEPLPADHPLWALPNVLISSHAGGMTDALRPRLGQLIRDQAARVASGRTPRNVVAGGPWRPRPPGVTMS